MGGLPLSPGSCVLAVLLGAIVVVVQTSEFNLQQANIPRRERRSDDSTKSNIFDRFALTARTKWENLWNLDKETPTGILDSSVESSAEDVELMEQLEQLEQLEQEEEEDDEDGDHTFERLFLEDPFFDIDSSYDEEEEEEDEEEGTEEESDEVFEREFLEDPYFDLDNSYEDIDEDDDDGVFEPDFMEDPFSDVNNSESDIDKEKTVVETDNKEDLRRPHFEPPFFDLHSPQHDVFDIKRMKRKLQLKKHLKKHQNRKKWNKMKHRKQRRRRKPLKKSRKTGTSQRMKRLQKAKVQASKAQKRLELYRKKSRGHRPIPVSERRYLTQSPERPNIILIVADDLGYNDVPWHNPDVRAPNIRKLARQGIILENHYVLPLCTPSRAALLTGIYPFRYGKQAGESLPLSPTGLNTSITLLPERLKTLGYSTHLIGKWHLGYCSWDYTPTRRGFDSFYGFYLGSQTYYTQYKKMGRRKGSLSWWDNNEVGLEYDYDEAPKEEETHPRDHSLKDDQRKKIEESRRGHRRRRYRGYFSPEENGGRDFRLNELPLANVTGFYSNDLYAARAEEVIRAHAVENGVTKTPLFMMLATQAVHGPVQVPLKYRRKHTATTKNLARRTFLGMVDALDDVIGRVVKQLKASGLYSNSVIIFTTDNGGNIQAGGNNFPLRGSKGGLYEGGTKGVAFIHSPLLPKSGFKYNGMMHIVDLHESILHVARNGASLSRKPGWRRALFEASDDDQTEYSEEGEEERDGVDMWPSILTNSESPRKSFVYNVRKRPLRGAIRRKNWKLIIGEAGKFDGWIPPTDVSAGAQTTEDEGKCCSTWHSRMRDRHIALYNLKDDPLETTDVSYLNPNVTSTLKSLLKRYAVVSRQPHLPKEDPLGHPSLHGGFFSPGWCQSIA